MIVGKTLMALTLTIIQGINISSRKIRRVEIMVLNEIVEHLRSQPNSI